MNPEEKFQELISKSQVSTDAETDNRILSDAIEHLDKLKQQKTPSTKSNFWRIIIKIKLTKFAAAAVFIIAGLIIFQQFGFATITWADVVEKFQSVEFFSAVFYEKDDALDEPEQFELWMGQGNNVRIRMGSQVIFGNSGRVTEAFDIETRQKVEPDARVSRMLEMLGTTHGRFSIDTVLLAFGSQSLSDLTPLVNPDAVISEDLVVFDSQLNQTQWSRIWALRESKLPVHIRIWGARDGYCLDAFLTYSNKQPDEFFDPNAFGDLLSRQDDTNTANIAYAFLTDPGGRDITPKDMSNKSQYHMPVVRQAGITEDGVFWVLAGKSRSYLPNGNVFDGFSRIEDDLGRTYISGGGGHRLRDDTSLNIFVPIDFPFDERRPSKITLFRETPAAYLPPNTEPELIGTIDLTEWEENAPCPNLLGPDYANTLNWKILLVNNLKNEGQTERLERLLQEIPDWRTQPRNSSLLLFWIRKAGDEMDFEEVIEIGEVLTPLLFENIHDVYRYAFREYLTALAATNQLDQAKSLFKRIDAVDKLSDEGYYDNNLVLLIEPLIADANLTDEQIADFLSPEYTEREGYESLLQRARQNAINQRARRAAQKRREEISEYYQSYPLPEKMELLEQNNRENMYFLGIPKTVPDNEYYKIFLVNDSIKDLISILKIFGDIQPFEFVETKVDAQIAEHEIFVDLVYKQGIGIEERIEFILNQYGYELVVEEGLPRKVLVAKYNGQPLKDFKDVKAPSSYDANKDSKVGMTSGTASNGWSLSTLFNSLASQQNSGIEEEDEKLVIVNETGIAGDENVSLEMALWPGAEGLEMAKQWFEEQFGITFTEETRPMKTYIVRKKTQ